VIARYFGLYEFIFLAKYFSCHGSLGNALSCKT